MAIDPKKYTRAELAKMVEEALKAQNDAEIAAAEWLAKSEDMEGKNSELEAQVRTLKQRNIVLTESIEQMNGEAVNKANEIARLKSDADALRTKLADTEAALGRANAEVSRLTHELSAMKKAGVQYASAFKYAVEHPFENLWEWIKRKMWWA